MKRKHTITKSINVNRQLIHFLQLNCHKSLVPTSFLGPELLDASPFIAIISEPPLKRKDSKLDGFHYQHSAFFSTKAGSPRAAIITSNNFAPISSTLHRFSSRDMITVRFDNLVVSSIYWHPNNKALPDELPLLIDWCRANSMKLVIGGDFNAHNELWKSKKTSPRGRIISDLISNKNLILLNSGSEPTWCSRGLSSIIDLTVSSSNISADIEGWKVSDKNMFSDHKLITFTLNQSKQSKRFRPTIRKPCVDYEKLRVELSAHLQKVDWNHHADNLDELNYKAESFHQAISKSIKNSTTNIYYKEKISEAEWWNEEIEEKRDILLQAKSDFEKDKDSNELYEQLKNANSNYNKSIRRGKLHSYQNFCSSRNRAESTKLIKQLQNPLHSVRFSCPSITNEKNEHFTNDSDALKYMVNTLAPGTSFKDSRDIPRSNYVGLPNDFEAYITLVREVEQICSTSRMKELLMNTNTNSAQGPDGIHYKTLEHCWDMLEVPVKYIFMDCLLLGAIPDIWLSSTGIFIPKPGIKEHVSPKNYRTINLSPCILKCLEKLIIWHLEIDLDLESYLHPSQFGFRRGKSCDHAISNLVHEIEQSLVGRGITVGIFIDISGAFDNVSTEYILKVLRNSPASKSVYNLIEYILSNRRVTYTLGKAIIIRLLLKGFAQGGRLGPTLWNLVVDLLLKRISIEEFIQAFADDIASLISGTEITDIRQRAQSVVRTIETWCTEAGLQINAHKSKIIIFTHRHNVTLDQPILYQGTPLPVSTTVKYLGVHLDSTLSWNTHLEKR